MYACTDEPMLGTSVTVYSVDVEFLMLGMFIMAAVCGVVAVVGALMGINSMRNVGTVGAAFFLGAGAATHPKTLAMAKNVADKIEAKEAELMAMGKARFSKLNCE